MTMNDDDEDDATNDEPDWSIHIWELLWDMQGFLVSYA